MATVTRPSDSVAGTPPPGGGGAGWQLGRRARQLVLVSHVVAVGCWLGLDVAFGILVLVALRADGATAAAAVLAIAAVAGWPLAGVALFSLGSGLLLGWGTRWGLFRYRWVVTKIVVTLALVGLVLAVLLPKVADLGRAARASLAIGSPMPPFADLAFPPVVSVTALLTATTLAVVKPGGRLLSRRHPTAVAEAKQDPEQTADRR